MSAGLLTHSAADVAAQALIDLGLGVEVDGSSTAWQVSVDIEPDSPDEVLVVKTTTGRTQGSSMITGIIERSFGVQVLIRSRLSNVGAQKAESIRDAMETRVYGMDVTVPAADGVPAGTYRINDFDSVGDVLPLGLEEGSNRFFHSVNGTVVLKQLS
jgi:hypothetical protein